MLGTHERLYGSNAPLVLGIPAYSVFVGLGLLTGLLYYFIDLKRRGAAGETAVQIISAALVCGVLGSRLPLLFEVRSWERLLYQKSIVGALLGGMFGVSLFKRLRGIRLKLGNIIAPAAALSLTVGRLGCFFNGCCYGIPASRGFDFGDGQMRLPVQLFEAGFHLSSFFLLRYYAERVKTPGILFKLYLLAYFMFRFFIEYIRVNPVIWGNMSIYQIISLLGILYVGVLLWLGWKKNGRLRQIE